MSIFGRLATMPLADLLQWLSLTKRTGILSLDKGAVHKELFFHDGALISASSSDPREFLSQLLIMHGKINEKELTRLYHHLQQHGGKLGRLMVEIGMITIDELQHYLRLKVEESIYDCFLWEDGAFHFFLDEPTGAEHLPIVTELNALTLEGMRRADEWKRIRAVIPSGRLRLSRTAPLPRRASPRAGSLHALLDEEPRHLTQIGMELHWPDFHLYEAAAELIRLECVGVEADADAAPVRAVSESGAERVERELQLAGEAMARKDFETARAHLLSLLKEAPHHPAAQELLQRIIERESRSAASTIGLQAVPVLTRKIKKAEKKKLSPQELFLLERLDGVTSVADLVHVAPMREAEIKELLAGFAASGLIKL